MSKISQEEINKSLAYIKATMAFEDLDLPEDYLEVLQKYLKGNYSEEKVFSEIDRMTQEKYHGLRKN